MFHFFSNFPIDFYAVLFPKYVPYSPSTLSSIIWDFQAYRPTIKAANYEAPSHSVCF